ncbi:hypothetical protein FOL47_000648 [Perkinsus chesapeaki]|uniref:Uncharacterized protein n=1 Tax=Perkinsus chesapeaki TaxID=330153 RepID=A0A7J6MMB1_PERCH|nr:hypothetical protein FOL47_000648 [Perkinsus chesapeaki]
MPPSAPYLNGVFGPILMGINGIIILFSIALMATLGWISYNPLYYDFFGIAHVDSGIVSSVLALMVCSSGIAFAAMNKDVGPLRFINGGLSAVMTVWWLGIAISLCHLSITFYKLRLDRAEITLVPSRDRYAQQLVDDLFKSFAVSYNKGECRGGGYEKATKMFIRPYCDEFQTFREMIRLAREPETAQQLEEWEYCMSDTPFFDQGDGLWCRLNAQLSWEIGEMVQWFCAASWILFVLLAASTVITFIGGTTKNQDNEAEEEEEEHLMNDRG